MGTRTGNFKMKTKHPRRRRRRKRRRRRRTSFALRGNRTLLHLCQHPSQASQEARVGGRREHFRLHLVIHRGHGFAEGHPPGIRLVGGRDEVLGQRTGPGCELPDHAFIFTPGPDLMNRSPQPAAPLLRPAQFRWSRLLPGPNLPLASGPDF